MGAMEDAMGQASDANAAAMAKLRLNSDGSYDWVGAQSSIPGAAVSTTRTPNADALDALARASIKPSGQAQDSWMAGHNPDGSLTATAPAPAGSYGQPSTGNYGYPAPAAAAAPTPAQPPSNMLQHAPVGPASAPGASPPAPAATPVPAPANPNPNPIASAMDQYGQDQYGRANNYKDDQGAWSYQAPFAGSDESRNWNAASVVNSFSGPGMTAAMQGSRETLDKMNAALARYGVAPASSVAQAQALYPNYAATNQALNPFAAAAPYQSPFPNDPRNSLIQAMRAG